MLFVQSYMYNLYIHYCTMYNTLSLWIGISFVRAVVDDPEIEG